MKHAASRFLRKSCQRMYSLVAEKVLQYSRRGKLLACVWQRKQWGKTSMRNHFYTQIGHCKVLTLTTLKVIGVFWRKLLSGSTTALSRQDLKPKMSANLVENKCSDIAYGCQSKDMTNLHCMLHGFQLSI